MLHPDNATTNQNLLPAVQGEFRELPPPTPVAVKARNRKRRGDLLVRDVQAKERLFSLAYCAMLVVAVLIGTFIGYWARGR